MRTKNARSGAVPKAPLIGFEIEKPFYNEEDGSTKQFKGKVKRSAELQTN
jgi:hypothetical protein